MANDFTTRLSIPYANDATDAFTIRQDIEDIVTKLDDAAMYEQGVVGSLPVGTTKPNGTWYADTASGGHVYVNVGTGGGRAYRQVPALSAVGGNLVLPGNVSAVDVAASGDVTVGDDLTVTDAATVGGTLAVTGATTLTGTLDVGGVRLGGSGSRGKSIIATEESRTNVAYGTLTTPDQVTGIVLPTDGLLLINFRALVKSSASAGTLAIFLGANQLKIPAGSGAPVVTERTSGPTTTDYGWIHTTPASASGFSLVDASGDATSVTTGVVAAQHIEVEAAAGTYTVSVQYKASSGSITAKERKLWVEARGY